jgi:transposase
VGRDATELKRLQAVRLYGSGRAVADIMEVTGCAESSLRRWVHQYGDHGLSGLRTDYSSRSQNSRKLSQAQCADLQQRLQHYRPDQLLSPDVRLEHGQFWTVSDLAIAVEDWYGVVYTDRGSYRNLLHRCGFSTASAFLVLARTKFVSQLTVSLWFQLSEGGAGVQIASE